MRRNTALYEAAYAATPVKDEPGPSNNPGSSEQSSDNEQELSERDPQIASSSASKQKDADAVGCPPAQRPGTARVDYASRSLTPEEIELLTSSSTMKFSHPASASRPQSAMPAFRGTSFPAASSLVSSAHGGCSSYAGSSFPAVSKSIHQASASQHQQPSAEPDILVVSSGSGRSSAVSSRPYSAAPSSRYSAGAWAKYAEPSFDFKSFQGGASTQSKELHSPRPSSGDSDTDTASVQSLVRPSLMSAGSSGGGSRPGSGRARQLPPMDPTTFRKVPEACGSQVEDGARRKMDPTTFRKVPDTCGSQAEDGPSCSSQIHSSLNPGHTTSSGFKSTPRTSSLGKEGGPPLPKTTTALRQGSVSRGQELLDELESELRELDLEFVSGAAGEVLQWHSDLENVLGQIDGLQTGYQALLKRDGKLPSINEKGGLGG
eukprot:gene19378-26027_t